MTMGLFSKKPELWKTIFDEYTTTVGAWCQRLRDARDAGAEISTSAGIITAVGPAPQLAVQHLPGSYEGDRAISAARAWLDIEAGRLSRADVLQGRSGDFWQHTVEWLYSDLPNPSY